MCLRLHSIVLDRFLDQRAFAVFLAMAFLTEAVCIGSRNALIPLSNFGFCFLPGRFD
jgi:hypothetical protein